VKNNSLQAIALVRQGLSPANVADVLGGGNETAFLTTFDTAFKGTLQRANAQHEKDLDYNAEEPEFDFNAEVDKLLPLAFQTAREIFEYGENEAVKANLFKWFGDQKSDKNSKGISFNVNDLNLRLETAQKRAEENFITIDSY
jgi:hypothetical protein|tara:strand:+ start:911 stop:1339 length:429 start_codon:yes stop_codon:yes gene_type:complete